MAGMPRPAMIGGDSGSIPLAGRYDLLRLLTKPGNAELHDVANLQKLRLRFHAERDTGWRAGADDVARLHDEELRTVPDQVLDPENHGLGRALLTVLAVHGKPHVERLRVGD